MQKLMRYDQKLADCEKLITQIETTTLPTHRRNLQHLVARAQAGGPRPSGRFGDLISITILAERESVLAWQTVEIERTNIKICELQIEQRCIRMERLRREKQAILSELGIGAGGFLV